MARKTNLRRPPRNRRQHDRSYNPLPSNVGITSIAIDATNLLVTLSAPMDYAGGIPAITCQGVLPAAIASVTPTTFVLDFAAAVVATNVVVVPERDPAFRTAGGGYITATRLIVP